MRAGFRWIVAAMVVLGGAFPRAQSVALQDVTEIGLYRGTTKLNNQPSWEACRAEAARLAQASTQTSGTVTYSCKTEVRKVIATYSATTPPAPVNCAVSDWALQSATAWSACSASGTQTRTETWARTVTTPPANGGTACPALTETRTGTQSCTVTPPTGTAIFASGWDNTSEIGCTLNGLLDGGLWGDFGPAFPGVCPLAQVVVEDGVRALRVTQEPGNQNGTDFRIERSIGSRSEITVEFRIKFGPEFRFATGDHKMLIIGGQNGQNVYANVRGTNGNPTQGRITVHVIPVDTAMSDASHPITVGEWHVLKVNVRAGTGGYVKVKLDGVLLTLTTEAGNQVNPNNLNTGAIDFIKPDTTYNIGSFITAPWNVFYDYVRVTAGNAAF